MMDVLYYYIYLFYVKVISDNQPHSNTIWALGFLFSLIINFSLDMGLAFFFGYTLSVFQMVSIAALLMLLFYFKYYKSGRGKQIVKKEKPKFFGRYSKGNIRDEKSCYLTYVSDKTLAFKLNSI